MDHIRSLHRTIDTGPTAGFTPKHSKDLADEAEAIPNAHGKLWKITAPNGAISHLWGTIHSTHRQLLELPDKLEALIDQARLVATEFSPIYTSRTDLANANSQDWMFRRALRPLLEYDTVFEGDIGIWLKARLQSMGWGGLECDLTDAGLAYLLMFDACDDFSSFSIPIQDNRIYMLGREVGAQTIGLEHAKDFQRYVSDPENSNTALAIVKSYAAYLNPELYEPATTLANTAGRIYRAASAK